MRKIYIKAPPGYTIKRKRPLYDGIRMFVSLTLIMFGITSLTTVVYPLLDYQLTVAPYLKRQTKYPNPVIRIDQAKAQSPTFLPEMINTSLDYTDATNWFPTTQTINKDEVSISYYTLSIPKLGIKNALVKIGGTDLKKSLIQYQGTALPGELGNPVIYGHSVLPQFFSPTNYTRIFSTLHTLKPGDQIIIHRDGVDYTYTVKDMYEVEPTNLSPLAQTYDSYRLTLITCTPPGTYLRRLIVEAVLQ